MNGKSKCRILKDIRKKIAEENDIHYVTTECKFQGNCSGTCPKCEAEVRYLEQELAKRRSAGKAAIVAGIATAMVVTASGCDLFTSYKTGKAPIDTQTEPTKEVVTAGSIAYAEETETTAEPVIEKGEVLYNETDGKVPYNETDFEQETEDLLLTGDVAWPIP